MKRIVVVCMMLVTAMVLLTACNKKNETAAPASQAVPTKDMVPAPDIAITTLDGKQFKLSELKGKVVLLNFWATWCPPCREELPSMLKLNAAMAGKPFQMVAISIDEGGAQAVSSFLASNNYALPAYLDPTGTAAKQYGITGVPESFIIDRNGVMVKKVVGGVPWDSPEVLAFFEGLMK